LVTRHSADLVSLVAGLMVLGLGLALLTGGIGDLPMEWVGPMVAIGLGLLILIAARQDRPPSEDEPTPTDDA
jgi:hypothetical protein